MGHPRDRNFGRYEIVAELGRGAMGVVYQARDPQIDRLVALKTISLLGQDHEEEQDYRRRFVVEAQAAGRLQHPGIVAIYDAGEEGESHDPYLVLEYVAGESLRQILKREKTLPLPKALQFTEELAETLDYAHAQGVVHRDIKPANILISEEGHAKIADFGIAQLNLAHLTLPGRVLGTPAFMAPEQLSGEAADGRSDLFSLGVILYAMVTGHSPFQGNSAATVSFKVVNREPMPATTFDLNLPPELDALICRAMAKDPTKRYQRASEFATAVRDLRQIMGVTTSSQSATSRTTTTRSNAPAFPSHADNDPAALDEAQGLLGTFLNKAPARNLIIGIALVVLLTIVGIPTHQGISPKTVEVAETAGAVSGTSAKGILDPGKGAITQNPAAGATAVPEATRKPQAAPSATPPVHSSKSHSARNNIIVQAKAPETQQREEAAPVPTSTLEVAIQHHFREATFSLWIDDKIAFTRSLHGENQEHLVVFHGIRGNESDTLKVPAGTHTLRLQTQSADQAVDLSKTISVDFISGNEKTLRITFEKHNKEMLLTLQ